MTPPPSRKPNRRKRPTGDLGDRTRFVPPPKPASLSKFHSIAIAISVSSIVVISGATILRFISPPSTSSDSSPSDVVESEASGNSSEPSTDESASFPNAPPSDTETSSSQPREISGTPPPLSGEVSGAVPPPEIPRSQYSQNTPIYNVTTPPQFQPSSNLQDIVDEVVNLAASRGLPTSSLSVYLIDLNQRSEAGFNVDVPRYPASVSKLFWMVAFYAWQAQGKIPQQNIDFPYTGCKSTICKLVHKSDNEAASRILDLITDTTSIAPQDSYSTWLEKRYSVNKFFQRAGYSGIDISQKNFPIPYLGMESPEGWDLQMRGDPNHPIRNKMTARHAARLMYEIASQQAVSPDKSAEMMALLKQDLNPEVWQPEEYDPIDGFLGEGIYKQRDYLSFYSKVGWTHDSRLEVVLVQH
ncbi:serine hydrolase, partial [Baaleninema sp.]|uniref:serine hydrolase n=1 Tax=Baaleninema sp. TaxID=3101197 RepID=UPI003D02762E